MALPITTAPMPQRWPQPPLKPLASAEVAEAREAAAMVAGAATANMVLRNMGSLLFLLLDAFSHPACQSGERGIRFIGVRRKYRRGPGCSVAMACGDRLPAKEFLAKEPPAQ